MQEDAKSVDTCSCHMSVDSESTTVSTILNEKRNRKLLEEDTVRLQNRVRVLLKEEERVEKRIAETEKRITLAENARRQNEAKRNEKALRQATEQQQLSIRRERNAQLRREGKKLRDERIAQLRAEKTALAKEGKEEKQLHKSLLDEDFVSEKKRAQEKNAEVKKLETEIKRKLTIHQTTKANKAHEDYAKRLNEERSLKKEQQRKLNELTQLELELIERLKKKQDSQEAQYSKLKETVGHPTKKGVKAPDLNRK